MSTKAIGYVRVSTEKQADNGVSLAAQREKIEAYAKLYDLDLVEIVEDAGASASTLDRPGLQRALDLVRRGAADALVVVKLDRLTRSVRDLGAVIESHFTRAALLSVGEQIDTRSAAGRLVLNVLMSVAQWEREAVGERTRAAMQHMRARGEYTGGAAPYGFRVEAGGLVRDEAEQAVLGVMRDLRARGLSLREIAATLTEAGYTTRRGTAWKVQNVHPLVGREAA